MSLQGSGNVSSSQIVDNGLYFNPFAGSSQSSFSSAVKLKDAGVATRPAYRRRGSDSSAVRRSRNDHDRWQESGTVHARSRTLDGVVGGSTSGSKSHPLAPRSSALGSGSSSSSLADTRPRLKRLLSDLEPAPIRNDHSADSEERPDASKSSDAVLNERVVIVHEVRDQANRYSVDCSGRNSPVYRYRRKTLLPGSL